MLNPYIVDGKIKKTYVIRTCDICKDTARIDSHKAREIRTRRGFDICWKCAQKRRKMPLGVSHGNYKHGLTRQGYRRITIDGKRVLEHRAVMEESIGRRLKPTEQVHHIDLNKLNNCVSNLHLFKNRSKHGRVLKSLEKAAFSFLGTLLWFDRASLLYVMSEIRPPVHEEPDMGPLRTKKLYVKLVRGTPYMMYIPEPHKWKRYHVAVMETYLGRPLENDEGVHHINGDTLDNNINNLSLMSNKQHRKAHASLLSCARTLYSENHIDFVGAEYVPC
jgi:hypothetical protein